MQSSGALADGLSMREDVLRGMRLGTILLAGLLAGVASYRVLHSFPPEAAERPAPPVRHNPPAVPNHPVSSKMTAVPPPPPVARKSTPRASIHRDSPPPPDQQTVEMILPESAEPEPAIAPEAAISPAAPAAPADPVIQKETPVHEEPGREEDRFSKPPSRGKRWIKAVGRFLRLTRREPRPETP